MELFCLCSGCVLAAALGERCEQYERSAVLTTTTELPFGRVVVQDLPISEVQVYP